MTYRSDEEARRLRREATQKELEQAKVDLRAIAERKETDESRGSALESRIGELEASLAAGDAPRPEATAAAAPAPKPFSLWRLIKGIGIAIGIVAIVGWMGIGCVMCVVEETGCRAFDREVTLRWGALVKSAEGINLPEGTPCTVYATFWTEPGERQVVAVETKVTCAGSVLFESDTTRPTITLVQEAEPGGYRYQLGSANETSDEDDQVRFYADGVTATITRTGRPRGYTITLALDTWTGTWRGDPAFVPRAPPRDPGFDEIVQRLGTVERTTGTTSVKVGDRCILRVRPIHAPQDNCRVRLSCAGRTLYDSHATCPVEGRAPVRSFDSSSEGPSLDMDLPRGALKVRERGPGIPYSADVALDP